MGSRFVRPETVRVPISNGDWIVLKKRLTAGEERKLYASIVKAPKIEASNGEPAQAPELEMDLEKAGIGQVLAYLVDWSLPEINIRGQSVDVVTAALDGLDSDSYREIEAAVMAHQQAVTAERDEQKKILSGASVS